jgi:D-xylulose reductase
MKSLVLEEKHSLSLRDFPIEREEVMGPRDVRVKLHTVGICGSDVHYYTHGQIGPFKVEKPMILGHEASGTVIEVGSQVAALKVGDRVCMEPGIPDPNSRATRLGMYNIDPAVRFWATPPVHGILRPTVVHPEASRLSCRTTYLSRRRRWSSPWLLACMRQQRRRSGRGILPW